MSLNRRHVTYFTEITYALLYIRYIRTFLWECNIKNMPRTYPRLREEQLMYFHRLKFPNSKKIWITNKVLHGIRGHVKRSHVKDLVQGDSLTATTSSLSSDLSDFRTFPRGNWPENKNFPGWTGKMDVLIKKECIWDSVTKQTESLMLVRVACNLQEL